MKDASAEAAMFEPTVLGAVRRYRILVVVFAVLAMVAAYGYTKYTGKTYRAQASVTAPIPQTQQNVQAAQYLDSQVLLMESPSVAQRAAQIANSTLAGNVLSASDFSGSGSASVTPPEGAAAGSYGASIIEVAFTATSPKVAQVGANSLVQAYVDVRAATIAAQYNNEIAGLDKVIIQTVDPTQQKVLDEDRNQELVNEQVDLAQQPTVVGAAEPTSPVTGGVKRTVIYGLLAGLVVGATIAYALASRRRGFRDRQDPAALYGVPLLGEIPAFEAARSLRSNGAVTRGLPMTADPHSAVAEAFRFTARSLERIRAERGPRLSLVFVSPIAGLAKSTVMANVTLALAEGGTRVLAVDADAGDGDLTARLLPGTPPDGGLEQALAGQQPLTNCVQSSPLSGAVSVLGSGPAPQQRVTGAARSKAAATLLATAKSSFDIVLIDSPALLQVAEAAELVDASDAAIIVLGPNELIRDHLEMVNRLKLMGADVVGYIYNRAPMPPQLARYQRNGSSAHPAELQAAGLPAHPNGQSLNGESGPSSELTHG
jgi:Mrp family chromosome partitioning ATPase/capsular polysaccharide biosynthesis protein